MADNKFYGKDSFQSNSFSDGFRQFKQQLSPDMLDGVAGGVLPADWEDQARQMAPMFKKMYPNATYEEACEIAKQYFPDPDDYAIICKYIKEYY